MPDMNARKRDLRAWGVGSVPDSSLASMTTACRQLSKVSPVPQCDATRVYVKLSAKVLTRPALHSCRIASPVASDDAEKRELERSKLVYCHCCVTLNGWRRI